MNLLSLIIDRLNQRVATYNLFDQIYGLSELNQNGNEKAWINYIGDGQAQVVSDYDGANGTIFWAKRGRVTLSKNEQYNAVSCKQLYLTSIPLTAYAIVRKSSLPCDLADSVDFVANQIFKYVSGKDVDFKIATGLIQYDVIPASYGEETKSLSKNYEWACVTVDFNIEITSDSNDGCYAPCDNVPLPPYNPPTGSCCNIAIYDEGQIITESVTQFDFTGEGVTATSVGGAVTITITGGGSGSAEWGSIGTGTGVSSQTDLVNYLLANFYPLLSNPSAFLVAADLIPYLTSANAVLTYFPIPTGLTTDYIRGDGSIAAFPSAGIGTVTDFIFTDGNGFTGTVSTSTSTPTLSLTIQTASASQDGQLSSADWSTFNSKGNGTVTSVSAGTNISVTGTATDPIINSLSDRYRTSSVTSNSVSNGAKTFTVDLNLSYIPLQEILVVYNPANHMHGEVTSYNPATGVLIVDIKNHTGSGTYTSWTINLDGTPVDAISGVGVTNEIAYFTGAQILSSLTTANNAILVTSGSGVPSISTTIPNGIIATTQPVATNNTTIATTAFVTTAIKTFAPYQRQNFWNRNTGGAFQIVYAAVNDVLYVTNNTTGSVYCFDCVTGALKTTISGLGSVIGIFYLPVKGEVYVTVTSIGTIVRLSTAATPTNLGSITGSGTWGECLVEYSATKAFIGNLSANTVTVINPTTNTTAATIAAITAPRGICLNSNVSSAQNDRIVVTGSGGVTIINPATNAVTAVASLVGGNLSTGVIGIIYISSQDLYVVCDNTNNRLCWLTPATATTFTASYFTYSLNKCWSLAYDSTNNVILVVGLNITAVSGTLPAPIIVWVIDALTRVCLRTILTNCNQLSTQYYNNYISIKTPGIAILSGVGSTLSTEIVYA